MNDALQEAADWLAADDATCWGEHEWRLFNVVEQAEAMEYRIEKLEGENARLREALGDIAEVNPSLLWPDECGRILRNVSRIARATLEELRGVPVSNPSDKDYEV